MSSLRFAFTIDDLGLHRYWNQGWHGYSSAGDFRELVEFLNGQKVPGTFFTVPFNEDIPLYDRPDYMAVMKDALAGGHEIQQHGLRHEIFEWGLPPESVLKVEPEAREKVARDPASLAKFHTYDMMVDKLRKGTEILTQVVGRRPEGFRAPCGSNCPALFQAIKDCGFQWDSTVILNPKGWNYCVKDYPTGIMWYPDIPPRPHKLPNGVLELPIMSEYTWHLTEGLVAKHLGLLKEDLTHLAEVGGGVLVSVCHVSPITGQWAAGQKVYEQFFPWARDNFDVQFCTMSQAAKPQPGAAKQ